MDASIEQLLLRHRKELSERDHEANKGTYGRLTLVAGSHGMAGAAFLSGLAAFRCGIGMVKYLGPECNRTILQTLLPEAMYDALPGVHMAEAERDAVSETESSEAGRDAAMHAVAAPAAGHDKTQNAGAAAICSRRGSAYVSYVSALAEKLKWGDYLVIGPGLSKEDEARQLVRALFDPAVIDVLQKKKLIVLDADALNLMAEEGLNPGELSPKTLENDNLQTVPVVITPHVMEMSRLTGISIAKIKEDPAAVAEEYARSHGVYVVLKDARTVVSCPWTAEKRGMDSMAAPKAGMPAVAASKRRTYIIDSGCGAMAKAGSGDVLCGFIAGFTAMLFGNVEDAVPLAVFMHGAAGCVAAERMGSHSILARDIAEAAGEALERALDAIMPVRGYDLG